MILLFNKVYLKLDHLIKPERDRIVVSPQYTGVSIVEGGFRNAANGVAHKPPLYEAGTYQQLIDEQFAGDDGKFLATLLQFPAGKRLTIYCDIPSMVTIASKFWKTLLPQLSADDYYRLVNFSASHIYEMFCVNKTSLLYLPEDQAQDTQAAIRKVFDDEQVIKDAWATITPFPCTRAQREAFTKSAGLEFQLPTLLVTPDWRYGFHARNRLVHLMNKEAIAEFVKDIKHIALSNIEMLHVLDPKAGPFNLEVDSLSRYVTMHPDYRFLVDDRFHPDNTDYVVQNYDLDVLDVIRTKLVPVDYRTATMPGSLLKQNLSFEDIIEFERARPQGRHLAARGEYLEKVNPYMIDYVLRAHFNGQNELLQPYVLR